MAKYIPEKHHKSEGSEPPLCQQEPGPCVPNGGLPPIGVSVAAVAAQPTRSGTESPSRSVVDPLVRPRVISQTVSVARGLSSAVLRPFVHWHLATLPLSCMDWLFTARWREKPGGTCCFEQRLQPSRLRSTLS